MHSLKKKLFQKFSKEGIIGCYFSNDPPGKEIEINFRIFFLNETDLNDLGIKDYNDALELDFTKALTTKNERNVRVMIFKCAEVAQYILSKGFIGLHKDGKQIEDIDKEIVNKYLNYYQELLNKN